MAATKAAEARSKQNQNIIFYLILIQYSDTSLILKKEIQLSAFEK